MSIAEPDTYINETIYINNLTESVDLPCGEDVENASAIYWSIFNEWKFEWEKILKMSPTSTDIHPYENKNTNRYGISESVNTSIVVKNDRLSENNWFRCTTSGEGPAYSYTVLLKVVGKSILFWSFSTMLTQLLLTHLCHFM